MARRSSRRPAAIGDGPRNSRARGGPRPGAHGRARPPARSARRRHRARAASGDRCEAALSRLGAEEETLRRETAVNEERRAGLDQRVTEADTALAAAEKTSDALTGTLADLTARRHALENSAREHGDRLYPPRRRDGGGRDRAGADRGRGGARRPGCAGRRGRRSRRQRSRRRKPPRCAPRRRSPPPARGSTSPAGRSPMPSAGRNGSTPKPRRWPSSCTSTPRACGRR